MLAHRFQEYWSSEGATPTPAYAGVAISSAFVPFACPLPAGQQAHAEYLYRVAFEQAQAEIARERRARWTTFSLN
jgi:hypothetical protein